MRRYSGLAIQWFGGLGTLIRAAFLRPVHIVRQSIPNLETGISRISTYHANSGLSSLPLQARVHRRITTIPGRITNQVSGICGYVAMRFVRNKVWNK
jgi:hypothetical protein